MDHHEMISRNAYRAMNAQPEYRALNAWTKECEDAFQAARALGNWRLARLDDGLELEQLSLYGEG